jgi:hypothetical protein
VANELRAPKDYVDGKLLEAAAVSDTVLKSSVFAGLPTNYSASRYLPLVLHDPSAGLYEVVWVTGHASSSTSVTVVRARESSAALAWPADTKVFCGPTVRDVIGVSTWAGLPSDAHLGARYAVSDRNAVAAKALAGWGPALGVAFGDDVGPRRGGSNPPSDAALLLRAGHVSGSTDGSGQLSVSFRQPFATAAIGVVLTGARASDTFYSVLSESVTGFVLQAWRVTDVSPYTTAQMGAAFTVAAHFLAIGY